ncbi:MAG TPA: EAL domain-containing protein [Dehalococcoidia bacterium]|nr:EAL domain-containing protein [Dehalococcoidia bacterium]
MLRTLQELSRICTRPRPSEDDILAACALVGEALKASDTYVLRAGDPAFIRVGCDCDPKTYEIKQKGYWLLWRDLATHPDVAVGTFDAVDRIVVRGGPATPGRPTTHLTAILPGEESNSDLLVARGPWPRGLTRTQIAFVEAARPTLAHLVNNVYDEQRRARHRRQLEALANVADVFSRSHEGDDVLTALATALAKASGFDWTMVDLYNAAGDEVVERAINLARYSDTAVAASIKEQRFDQPPPGTPRLGVALARSGRPLLMPDVNDDAAWSERSMFVTAGDPGALRKFYERAHIVSTGVFPIVFQNEVLGAVSFSACTPHAFDSSEVEFLQALVSQAATVIKGLRLYQELLESREEIHRREEWFRSLVQNACDLITVIDPDTTIRYQSPSSARILGYDPEAVVGHTITEAVHPDDAERLRAAVQEMMERPREAVAAEIRLRRIDGSWRHVEFTGADLRENPAIDGIVLNGRDVTERKLLELQLQHQALHDPLTRLANRRRFIDRLEHALLRLERAGGALALLFMDLDDFKRVNDSLGHSAGDRLLTDVAERVQGCLRSVDTVARLGGDEFAVLLEDLHDLDEAAVVADRILQALRAPFTLADNEVLVRASIGIAYTEAGKRRADAETLMQEADTAMYAAKAHGKGRFQVFEEAMQASMLHRLELLADLRRAVERGEFVVHYQPIMSLKKGGLFGFEALVRWRHPDRGMVPPLDFIPLAEESGLIVPLGHWVLSEACAQAAQWRQKYPDSGAWAMSVNVSARQLQHAGFAGDVARVLRDTGLPPDALILELTESAVMRDMRGMLSAVRELKDLGVRLAVDDFGTGYSSLNCLREFPFDFLKIDKAFIDDLGEQASDREIAQVIVRLGKMFDLELVAEGIEREAQLSRLRRMSCGLGQGYLFAKPLEPPAVEELLASAPAGVRSRRRAA